MKTSFLNVFQKQIWLFLIFLQLFLIQYINKNHLLYIPDANDPIIRDIYDNNYYEVIEFLKTGKIAFKNKFFELEEAINKIIYYINNNYTLENEMKEFYDSFELNKRNNTIDFINYIIK